MSRISFARTPAAAIKNADVIMFMAPQRMLSSRWIRRIAKGPWTRSLDAIIKDLEAGSSGCTAETYTNGSSPTRVVLASLPDDVSRHNCPARHEAVAHCMASARLTAGTKSVVFVGLEDREHFLPVANAAGRSMPVYNRKSGSRSQKGHVVLCGVMKDGTTCTADNWTRETMTSGRWAARMVDTPPSELHTNDFVREARKLVRGLKNVRTSEIVGNRLLEKKLAGIHAVGRTATTPPRLLVLDYRPARPRRTIALVGKGIIYDTGGLSLKGTLGMCSMKGDMGGGAAMVGAFRTLAANEVQDRVICLVPLAENAIGPKSYRNDDILTMHSGKTVEINNTDAEGRIVLADAVSYACRTYRPDAVMDAATLTGAQLITSGIRHGSVVSNREGVEQRAVESGRASGDLAHAILFAPEFFMKEFESKVADMKNSVANRSNAQSSCAGQFIYAHIDDLDTPWIHVDLAGPAFRRGRGTGYGVALISSIVRRLTKSDLAR